MSNEYINNAKEKLSIEWKDIDGVRQPTIWTNDKTKLNADNLNRVSNSISDLLGVTSTNERVLKSVVNDLLDAVSNLLANWSDTGSFTSRLVLAKGLTVTEDATFNSNLISNGNISVASGKDIKIGNASLSNAISRLTTAEENVSKNSIQISNIQGTVGEHTTRLNGIDGSISALSGDFTTYKETTDGTLSGIGGNILLMKSDIDSLKTGIQLVDTNRTNLEAISGINLTEKLSEIEQLTERVTALENMIAAGTQDPEYAGLNDNTKYYIKYED